VELTKNPDAMISALRKIEGRGELEGATSAVMEMCIDNPRTGFSNIFDTHPPIDARVAALVKFAGGHDPGPLALPEPQAAPAGEEQDDGQLGPPGPASGPWGSEPPAGAGQGDKPFLPQRPPIELGGPPSAGGQAGPLSGPLDGPITGPWGPHRK
jgi:heat shock protein HtpX